MNPSRTHQGSVPIGLLIVTSIIALLAITIGLNLATNVRSAFADAPTGTISASVSGTTVNLSGTWNFVGCKPENKSKVVGFGLFLAGNNPIAGPSLDTTMHFADPFGQNPCTSTSGTWSDVHTLTAGSHEICVVFYDPHVKNFDKSGDHSLVLTGPQRNKDNSFEKNLNSFPAGTCVGVVVPPSPPPPPGSPGPAGPPGPTAPPAVAQAVSAPAQLPTTGGEPTAAVGSLVGPLGLAVASFLLLGGGIAAARATRRRKEGRE